MMRADTLRFVVPTLPAVFLAVFLGGCSLVVDFDRSLLVDAGVDAGLDAGVGFSQINDRAERVKQVELGAFALVI